MAYIRKRYGIPAKRGMTVVYTHTNPPLRGRITSADRYVNVRFDGLSHSVPLHPTWRILYLDDNGDTIWPRI